MINGTWLEASGMTEDICAMQSLLREYFSAKGKNLAELLKEARIGGYDLPTAIRYLYSKVENGKL